MGILGALQIFKTAWAPCLGLFGRRLGILPGLIRKKPGHSALAYLEEAWANWKLGAVTWTPSRSQTAITVTDASTEAGIMKLIPGPGYIDLGYLWSCLLQFLLVLLGGKSVNYKRETAGPCMCLVWCYPASATWARLLQASPYQVLLLLSSHRWPQCHSYIKVQKSLDQNWKNSQS